MQSANGLLSRTCGLARNVPFTLGGVTVLLQVHVIDVALIGIKRFDHETKVKARSERRNLQTASQLCTRQVGTGEINQIIESLLKVKVQRITKTY